MIVQMNTRIDDHIKSAGDAAFAEAGYTPSQVVRAVWGYAERNRGNTAAIGELLSKLCGEDLNEDDRRKQRLETLGRTESLVGHLLKRHGLILPESSESIPYAELRERALEERYAAKGLL